MLDAAPNAYLRSTPPERTDANWIQTYTRRAFWPLNPEASDIDIEDIAHALSMKCRFSGHTVRFYSVAQHSRLVSAFCPEARLWGLLHDAAEAYLPDVARPIKSQLTGFKEMEERILRCVAERFELPWPIPECVHEADLRALATERRDLMPPSERSWASLEGVEPWRMVINPQDPPHAEHEFLRSFHILYSRWFG